YRFICKVIPSSKRLFPLLIKEYNNNYSISVKFSILCYYKIFLKIAKSLIFNK
ncbi:hypothetical protein BDP55DRAFT_557118, partial [Colletotrichum godetiae]